MPRWEAWMNGVIFPHLWNPTLDGPNLYFTGCVPEGTLVSQGSRRPENPTLRGLWDIWPPGLTQYQHCAKLSGLRNAKNTEDTQKVSSWHQCQLGSLESRFIHSLTWLTAWQNGALNKQDKHNFPPSLGQVNFAQRQFFKTSMLMS